MNSNLQISIKEGKDMTQDEMDAINEAKFREWKKLPMDEAHKNERIFALLKDNKGLILAQAQLHPIDGVTFQSKSFSLLDIGAVISHVKGMGYGEMIMRGVIHYLKESKKIGIGFTGDETIQFFRKCGFEINCSLVERFVLIKDEKKMPYSERNCIFYFDPENIFFAKVLESPHSEVIFPVNPEW